MSDTGGDGCKGSIVLAIHAHLPRTLGRYRSIDQQADYFDGYRTRDHCRKYVANSIIPTNRILLGAIRRHEGRFRCAISVSGIALDLFEKHAPEAIASFRDLVDTECVEMLGTPYHQGFAFAYSIQGFADEVERHRDRVAELFGQRPRVFRNTELICGEQVANTIAHLEFDAILGDAPIEALAGRSFHQVYACGHSHLPLLMRDADLTRAVSGSFTGGEGNHAPLTAPEFAKRLGESALHGVAGLFFDYEVFGTRFKTETGIFEFLRHLPDQIVASEAGAFVTPSDVLRSCGRMPELHLGRYVSPSEWGGALSPWLGGSMQSHAAHQLFALETELGATAPTQVGGDGRDVDPLLDTWRCLQAADYLLAMSMSERAVAESHHLIAHLDGPYHAYIVFMNILDDLSRRMRSIPQPRLARPDVLASDPK